MKIHELFKNINNTVLKGNGIEDMSTYFEDIHYKDFVVYFHTMYNTSKMDHCCIHRPCCYYKGKTGMVQLFDLTTGTYKTFKITKHELTDEQVKMITDSVNNSLNHWFNLYTMETRDNYHNECPCKLDDGLFGWDRIGYYKQFLQEDRK